MKIYMKILVAIALLISINATSVNKSSTAVKAAYDYSNLSCTNEQGRDIVFVIQDTPDMQTHDPEQSRVTEVLALMDEASDKDRFGLVGFSNKVTKELPLTGNIVQAKTALKSFGTDVSPDMANDLSKGLGKAVDELTKKSTSNDKVIVIMTVGNSIYNEVSKQLAAEAYEADITIHTISFGDPLYADVPFLTEIANLTGGNYKHSPNAAFLKDVLSKLSSPDPNFSGREVYSDWTLTQDVLEPSGLLIHDNVKIDLNGYDLTVNGDLVMQSCSELRAVNGVITAKDIRQQSRSTIHLNNSQLHVTNEFVQDGNVFVNGKYSSIDAVPEIKVNNYTQKIHGYLKLAGQSVEVESDFLQEGLMNFEKGRVIVKGDAIQKGYLNVQQGKLQVNGNLTINGGPLVDNAFLENKSLNVGGGVVQVGFDDGIGSTGNVKQLSGQLFVNHGTVEIFGDYTISDGWLTMIKGSMDTKAAGYGPGDGDYVRVHGNFTMASLRNHMERNYNFIGTPMNDQAHLTDGVLEIAGHFTQTGNAEYHNSHSDRYYNYEKSYSKYNFNASGRHKVLLTGKGNINFTINSSALFNILEVNGKYSDYTVRGPVKYNQLIERSVSANANLASLVINDIPVVGFNPNVKNYFNHIVPPTSFTSGVSTLKVDARADDYLNAKVHVLNTTVNTDGTAKVQVLVTAHDGVTQNVYTVNVKVGPGTNGNVTSVELDRDELLFTEEGTGFRPNLATLTHTVYPTNADNQKVIWSSSNEDVVKVNPSGIVTPVGIGQASITVTTEEGNFSDSVTVKVLKQADLLEGIKTLADLISDNDRYDRIMSSYDMKEIGIVVPGMYIQSVDFTMSGNLAVGTVKTNTAAMPQVARVDVGINGRILPTYPAIANEEFIFSRSALSTRDYVEVIAYDAIGNELERVSSSYPINFKAGTPVAPGFYSIQRLLSDPAMFSLILDYYSPEQLRFAAQ